MTIIAGMYVGQSGTVNKPKKAMTTILSGLIEPPHRSGCPHTSVVAATTGAIVNIAATLRSALGMGLVMRLTIRMSYRRLKANDATPTAPLPKTKGPRRTPQIMSADAKIKKGRHKAIDPTNGWFVDPEAFILCTS